jgi:hypothetical protein
MDVVDRNKPQNPPTRNLTGAGLGLDASGKRIFLLVLIFQNRWLILDAGTELTRHVRINNNNSNCNNNVTDNNDKTETVTTV